MPENQAPVSVQLAEGYDPFGDDNAPQVQPVVEVTPTPQADPVIDPAPAAAPATVPDPEPDPAPAPSFDPNQFMKERFGFDSVEQAEQEFKKVKDFKEPTFDFQDDASRTLFNAIKEGKTEDVYDILNQQKKLEKLTTAEIDSDLAADIIKTNIANKYKDLTSDEVELLFYDNYYVPLKPEQGFDETDEDYNAKVKTWQSQVDYVQKKMIIDAKVVRPELAKLKSELKLPDIYNEAAINARSQEEFEAAQQSRQIYEQTLNAEFQNFKGFNVVVKDEEVEIPISFNISDDERLALKEGLSDFDVDSYFENRWFTEEGKPNVNQAMADRYVLENLPKIIQKFANEAASQRLLAHLKKSGNVSINQPTPQGVPTPNADAERDRLAEWAFSN